MALIYICDWTNWQGEVCPAGKIEAEGFAGVKLKAGGSSKVWEFINPYFHDSAQALLATNMVPMAYWYLTPEKPRAQGALFADVLYEVSAPSVWGCFLDVEQAGLNWGHVQAFAAAWRGVEGQTPLAIYTRKSFWERNIKATAAIRFPFLEEAHWVSLADRENPNTPYASQQYRAVDPEWWNTRYAGWPWADMLQFTDKALIAGKRTTASVYRGTPEQLRRHLRISQ